ncbi:dipeptidase 1-like [Sinocyclocheilus rhinocerous]|uniref:dipeptidase 1-like n=1 Tax=Sinocyclocheilus rhinocerous TaxID=307959 RepID=UPI0007B956FA|nr:PREDICTED: dipeptidase 1-like [Sinocyclocheilus rhinocerous]
MDWVKTVCLVLWAFTFNSVADDLKEQALKLMADTPLIDGHNDLPWQMRSLFNNQLNTVDLYKLNSTHTNIPKIKEGHLSAQFWAAYVPCDTQYKDAVRQTLEQIDVIHRMCHKYPEVFKFAASSQDILDAFEQNKTASLIGVEGGHSIDSSLGTLRTMYQLGVRYLTITHSCNTPWADNWLVDTGSEPEAHGGLSDFGKQVIREMNRIGMLIDLSHVSEKVMNQVLDISEAPVIFSHSSAYSICNHKRNVPDDVLMRVIKKKGIVMVNFYNDYVTCQKTANISDVADHFDHIKKVAGSSIIGFGGDYDGVPRVPDGLEDVSKYPNLVAELLRRKWSDEEIRDALGRNLLRVFREVEEVRDRLNGTKPDDIPIPLKEVQNPCRTDFGYQHAYSLSIH